MLAFESEGRTLKDAAQAVEALKAEACNLQRMLTRDLRPALTNSQQEEASLQARRDECTRELDGLAVCRQEAAEQVGSITKRQLSEIKQMTRSPPDSIRRTMMAAWLLLHGKRFQGKPTVSFDETKAW
jgi:hypothetical protein